MLFVVVYILSLILLVTFEIAMLSSQNGYLVYPMIKRVHWEKSENPTGEGM